MSHYTTLHRLAGDKHSSLLGPTAIYDENEAFLIQPLLFRAGELFLKRNIFRFGDLKTFLITPRSVMPCQKIHYNFVASPCS